MVTTSTTTPRQAEITLHSEELPAYVVCADHDPEPEVDFAW